MVIGANAELTPERVEAVLAPHWDRLEGLVVSFEIPEACVAATVRLARAHDLPVVVDAGPPRRYGPETWGGATVLSPNELEAGELLGYAVSDDASAESAARYLLARGPEAVVLKRGAKGSLVCSASGVQAVPAFAVDVVDTTGAGDAFTAGLTLALVEGRSLTGAARFANAAGAVAVTRVGTMKAMPSRAEVEALLQR